MSRQRLTKDQQRKQLVEGLGLGILAIGANYVENDKMALEFAIGHALRRWPHNSDYPSIMGAHDPANEVYLGIWKSEGRRAASVRWEVVKPASGFLIRIAHGADWTPEEVVDHNLLGDRPLQQWQELATLFQGWYVDDAERRKNAEN